MATKIFEKRKITDMSKKNAIANEISILDNLCHPGIIKYYQRIEDVNRIYMVIEYAGSLNLKNFLAHQKKNISLNETKIMFTKILDAVFYLHDKNIVHRDIKPENIVLNSIFCPKLVDFGFATQASNVETNNQCGTSTYMSPEMITSQSKNDLKAADMWALGIVLYRVVVGRQPFKGRQGLLQVTLETKSLRESQSASMTILAFKITCAGSSLQG